MIERLELGPGAADESEAHIFEALDRIDERLAGSDYLVGGRFTRADLTAAALLAPLTWPAEHDFTFPPLSMLPPRLRRFRDAIEDRPVRDWSLSLYTEHRRPAA